MPHREAVDASFDHFLVETLDYLSGGRIDATSLPAKTAVGTLLQMLQAPDTLVILDGFERVLRAFSGLDAAYQGDDLRTSALDSGPSVSSDPDCISPLAEMFLYHVALQPRLRSKVLLTTRLCPRILEARGGGLLPGTREERLRQMQSDDLRDAAGDRGEGDSHRGTEAQRRRGKDLQKSPPPRRLRASVSDLDSDLGDLVARGLVHHEVREGRFDLHPIVRRYAYDRLAAPERTAAHTRLRDYFAAVPKPDKVTRLEDLAPVIELYHHTVRAGQLDEAFALYRGRFTNQLYYQLGAYQLIIDLVRPLFPDGEDRPPRLKHESAQAWTLNALANSYSLSGQPRRAVPLFEQQNAIQEKRSNKSNLAIGLGNVAYMAQLPIGALQAAEANLRRSISLCREIEDEFREAIGHQELGRLLTYRGAYAESETELRTSTDFWVKTKDVQGQCMDEAYRALRELLRLRQAAYRGDLKSGISNSKSQISDLQSVLPTARRALELAQGGDPNIGGAVVPRDLVRAHWLLGAAHRVARQTDEAERHLHEALERCRRINAVDAEADILIDLARLRLATGAADEAKRLADEALLIADRSGYVLQAADAHLELAKLAHSRGDRPAARHHAAEARRHATCDGPPDYTYAAAYAEAESLLAERSTSSLQ